MHCASRNASSPIRAFVVPSSSVGRNRSTSNSKKTYGESDAEFASYLSVLRDGGASRFCAFGKSFLNSSLAFSRAASSPTCFAVSTNFNCDFGFSSGRLRLVIALPRGGSETVSTQDTHHATLWSIRPHRMFWPRAWINGSATETRTEHCTRSTLYLITQVSPLKAPSPGSAGFQSCSGSTGASRKINGLASS